MPIQKKTSIYFAIELSLRKIYFVVVVHASAKKSCAVGMHNATLRNHLKLFFLPFAILMSFVLSFIKNLVIVFLKFVSEK